MNATNLAYLFALTALFISCQSGMKSNPPIGESPSIINIVNFIRQTDYRFENSDSLMFDAVERQVKLSKQYKLPTTFLFQYDALINPKYQTLMKEELNDTFELGAWWEITQPHVEAAGITWRGEHSWVSTANVAFTPGYTQAEREKLVDVYMSKFKEIYGKYPRSVASWFIDAHTLMYMYEKYDIIASANCKDQVGTDGYTLWGGYRNQGYYPSKKNAYMPAQTQDHQIPVPIFRMLGSDPMYQYDTGVGTQYQSVISLEPVYKESGKSKEWVNYFLESIVNEPSLAYNYAQAGQENSFTWEGMGEGLEMQFPLFDSLRNAGKIRIETLGETGKWFKENFETTPATAITTLKDIRGENNKSVWYNSRFYRSNLFWEKDDFCFRDIHLFDENVESTYLHTPGTGNQFFYYTLPVVDRFYWSTKEDHIGLKVVSLEGKESTPIVLKDPLVSEPSISTLRIENSTLGHGKFIIEFEEGQIVVSGDDNAGKWGLELRVPEEKVLSLPFQQYAETEIKSKFAEYTYNILLKEGKVQAGENQDFVFRLVPSSTNKLIIDCQVR